MPNVLSKPPQKINAWKRTRLLPSGRKLVLAPRKKGGVAAPPSCPTGRPGCRVRSLADHGTAALKGGLNADPIVFALRAA